MEIWHPCSLASGSLTIRSCALCVAKKSKRQYNWEHSPFWTGKRLALAGGDGVGGESEDFRAADFSAELNSRRVVRWAQFELLMPATEWSGSTQPNRMPL